MSFLHHSALRCPQDQLPLHQANASSDGTSRCGTSRCGTSRCGTKLHCANGHSFDIARQGYANLLCAQDKRSKDPGDSKAMVKARHAFLQAGYYQPLASNLYQLLQPELRPESVLVDAGCGEAYYIEQLCRQLDARGKPRPAIIGFDISKWALQVAARSLPATWLVASNRKIPLADHCADIVLSVFGFPHFAEFARVLKPGGLLLLADAGPHHLLELREILYEGLKPYRENSPAAAIAAGFRSAGRTETSFKTATLGQDAIDALLAMTPHLYRASAAGKQRASAIESLALTVDVRLELLRQKPLQAKTHSPE
jgi:23S rRNA (guanine745-N1)-methyltransferase